MWATGGGPNKKLEFWISYNGSEARRDSATTGIKLMSPGSHNFTFITAGRIAITYDLGDFCGWGATSTGVDLVCSSIHVNETTAFHLYAWTDKPEEVRVAGDADSYFFNKYLEPLGQASRMTYEGELEGVVVIVPRGSSANVTFAVSPVLPAPSNLAVVLAFIAVVLAVPIIVVFLAKRQKKGERKPGIQRSSRPR